jgi:hypothetical protein
VHHVLTDDDLVVTLTTVNAQRKGGCPRLFRNCTSRD